MTSQKASQCKIWHVWTSFSSLKCYVTKKKKNLLFKTFTHNVIWLNILSKYVFHMKKKKINFVC